MKKVISFSVWGKDEKYIKGCYENILLAEKIYPGWICRFYCAQDVDAQVCKNLVNMGAEVCNMEYKQSSWEGLFWRFLAAGDPNVDIFISRDIDSRLNIREYAAVQDWLSSDKDIHTMRDHIEHNVPILGGMWGCRNKVLSNIAESIDTWTANNYKGSDQDFLRHVVFEKYRNNIIAHDKYANGIIIPQMIKNMNLFETYIKAAVEQNETILQAKNNYIESCRSSGSETDQEILQNNFKLVTVPEVLYDEKGEPYHLYEYNPIAFFGEHDLREFPLHEEMTNCLHVGEIIE